MISYRIDTEAVRSIISGLIRGKGGIASTSDRKLRPILEFPKNGEVSTLNVIIHQETLETLRK